MSTPQLERITSHLKQLGLIGYTERRLEALLDEASRKELTYSDFVDALLTEEIASKREKALTLRNR